MHKPVRPNRIACGTSFGQKARTGRRVHGASDHYCAEPRLGSSFTIENDDCRNNKSKVLVTMRMTGWEMVKCLRPYML